MQDRYNEYLNNYSETWKDKFTWKGLYGDTPKYSITIYDFARETNVFNTLTKYKNARAFRTVMEGLADNYTTWAMFKGVYTSDEVNDLHKFFMGALGEFFFTALLKKVKTFLIRNQKTDKLERFDFDFVAPRLIGENDFGVDLTGCVQKGRTSNNCVFQVKFWNPELDTPITNTIASGAFTDAVINHFIKPNTKNNIVVCWLGDTDHVSTYLKKNVPLYEHIIFIDNEVLDKSINNAMPDFWDFLYKELQTLKDL